MNLDKCNLSVKTYLNLKSANINTVEDLCGKTEDDIIRIRNLGRRSLEEILNFMEKNNLKFKEA